MVIERVKELLEGSGDLLRAEAELAGKRAKRMLVSSAAFALCGVVTLTGVGLMLGALGVRIAAEWGVVAALGTIGGGLVVLGGIGIMIAKGIAGRSDGGDDFAESADRREPEVKAEDAKQQMEDAVTPDDDRNPLSLEGLGQSAVDAALRNPLAVGSAALLVVALLGPRRTFRVVSKGAAVVGLATSLMDALSTDDDSEVETVQRNGQSARPAEGTAQSQGAFSTHRRF